MIFTKIKSSMAFLLIIMLCLLFSSCVKKQSLQSQESLIEEVPIESNRDILTLIEQQEMLLVDIPLPLYNERIIPTFVDTTQTDTMVFGYKSPLSRQDAMNFFINQMERYGWKQLVCFDSFEIILEFESPYRYCTILIREAENNNSSIFIFIKKSEQKSSL